jgi:hypothetical protein
MDTHFVAKPIGYIHKHPSDSEMKDSKYSHICNLHLEPLVYTTHTHISLSRGMWMDKKNIYEVCLVYTRWQIHASTDQKTLSRCLECPHTLSFAPISVAERSARWSIDGDGGRA